MTLETRTAELKFQPLPAQKGFINSQSRISAYIGGLGSGKTFASIIKAFSQPRGSLGLLVEPTYPMVRDILVETLTKHFRPFIADFNKSEMVLRLVNDTRIWLRSADNPERLRGVNVNWAGLDEAGLMNEDAYRVTLGRLRLAPGQLWITTTPKRSQWLRELVEGDDVETFRASTFDNPHLPKEYIDSLNQAYSGAFKEQELYGRFIDSGGQVFGPPTFYSPGEEQNGVRKMGTGVDFAYTENGGDSTVFIGGVLGSNGVVYVTKYYSAKQKIEQWSPVLTTFPRPVYGRLGGTEAATKAYIENSVGVQISDCLKSSGDKNFTGKFYASQPAAADWNSGMVQIPSGLPWSGKLAENLSHFVGEPGMQEADDDVDALASLHYSLKGNVSTSRQALQQAMGL